MRYTWDAQAELEYIEAAEYYGRIDPDLGDRFVQAVEEAIEWMRSSPELFRRIEGDARKVRVKSFPYAVIYRFEGSELNIVTLMHLHRRPGYWRDRLG